MGARLYAGLIHMATDPHEGTDIMKVLMHMAGVLVETYLVFEEPDVAMEASFDQLADLLGCEPLEGIITRSALPPSHVIDFETERGRFAARMLFEEWLDCEFEFHKTIISIIQAVFVAWEEENQSRAESFRLLVECTKRCMAYEIAAQELCDIVIDKQVGEQGWSLGDCIAALSAVAGRRVALSINNTGSNVFNGPEIPEYLDHVVYVMTQEAVRLGVPVGQDWRFGLPANDTPVNAPISLILGIEPYCKSFFEAIKLMSQYDQSVCCAKAAGRMVAVAAGGESPEIEPAIAKPLAMAAITETYKSVCMDYRSVSL